MKKSLLIFSLVFIAHIIYAQKVYTVQSGDTLYNISKKQGISIQELFDSNPNLEQNGLKKGVDIILPSPEKTPSKGKIVYKVTPGNSKIKSTNNTYTVQKGDTLYAISKKFNSTADNLIKINPELSSGTLKVGQVLNLSDAKKVVTSPISTIPSASVKNNKSYYTVVKGDTFYSLAKRFNTDEATLKTYNPILTGGLKVGQQIHFPKVDDGFLIHHVKKGETIFSITRKYNVTLDTLLEYNPNLKNGLKTGMKLKVPVNTFVDDSTTPSDGSKSDFLNVVYILPFNSENYAQSKKRSFRTAEFYMGSLFALDSLASKGKKIRVTTFDNNATLEGTKEVAKKINLDEVDLIIGPLRSENVYWIADHVKSKKIKVISPFSKSVKVENRENIIKANLSKETVIKNLSDKIKVRNQLDSLFVIGNENSNLIEGLKKEFKNSYVHQITSIKEYDFTITPMKSSIILNTTNASIAKAALRKMYDAKIQNRTVKVFAVGYNSSYVKGRGTNNSFLGSSMLTDLGLTAIIPHYFNDNKYNVYKTKYDYKNKNKAFPDKYSSAGFDWTYYMLLENEFKNPTKIREGLFNKIQLEKTKNGGYINKGLFIIKY